MPNETIKILIVDDHPMVRKGLAMFVNGSEGLRLVGEASNMQDALDLYEREQPDVVLMDMVLPETSGADIIRKIRQRDSEAAIIALTSFGEEKIIKDALQAGARGFLYKNVSVEELAEAIRQVHMGRTILDTKASDVMLKMVNASDSPEPASTKTDLSQREYDVLQLLIQGLTNKQIATQLDLQPSTVKQYVSNIIAKLGVQSRTEAVAVALKLDLKKR